MDICIELGTINEADELEQLYDAINDYLKKEINYPGWIKGIYPIRQTAIKGITDNTLFVAKYKGKIIGSIILNHEPESGYSEAGWEFELDYSDVLVVHTLAVHPNYLKCGVGRNLMYFALQYGRKQLIKSIRLDVYEGNTPAIRLYEKCGFNYIGTVDMGLESYHLKWFKLYEKALFDK